MALAVFILILVTALDLASLAVATYAVLLLEASPLTTMLVMPLVLWGAVFISHIVTRALARQLDMAVKPILFGASLINLPKRLPKVRVGERTLSLPENRSDYRLGGHLRHLGR